MKKEITSSPLPFFFIGKDSTTQRINNYINNKQGLLSQALGKDDTKSIWYSKEHIAKLLEEIEYAGGDGMRIYFGAYETGHTFEGQLCLMMVSTKATVVGGQTVHTNVYLEDQPDFEDRYNASRNIELPRDPGSTGYKDFNYGSPCPPVCD